MISVYDMTVLNGILSPLKLTLFQLRNKFHFSGVRGSMNATGHLQSKWRPKGSGARRASR